MMTSSNGNIFRVTGPLCGEFTGPGEFPTQRPVMRSFDVFFDLRPNKRLSKQWRGWWFETLSRPFWRHRNVFQMFCDRPIFKMGTPIHGKRVFILKQDTGDCSLGGEYHATTSYQHHETVLFTRSWKNWDKFHTYLQDFIWLNFPAFWF